MTMPSPDGFEWPAPLAYRLADDVSAGQVADTVVALWAEIEQALHPILGQRGVAALYNRSLGLTAAAHPWLRISAQGVLAAIDPVALRAALAAQPAAEAVAGGHALFLSFHTLLASLIGRSLTERLLRPVWAHSTGASPAQDTSS
jgi:hypothetical protein